MLTMAEVQHLSGTGGDNAMMADQTQPISTDPEDLKESEVMELSSDKKTDEVIEPQPQRSLFWRLSSGVYNTAAGAVNMGVGSVKWAAGTGYAAGATVLSTTKTVASKVPVPSVSLRRKDKKE